jgi:DNA polymerase III subunit beta
MQLKQIPKDALLKPLQAVSGIVERRQTLPILANVLLEQKEGRLFVTATDLEMQITAHSELPGKQDQSITVGARKLQDLLRALPEDAALTVDATGGKMTLALQSANAACVRLPADQSRAGAAADHCAAAARLPRAAQACRVRHGPAGHPLLPQRHAVGDR